MKFSSIFFFSVFCLILDSRAQVNLDEVFQKGLFQTTVTDIQKAVRNDDKTDFRGNTALIRKDVTYEGFTAKQAHFTENRYLLLEYSRTFDTEDYSFNYWADKIVVLYTDLQKKYGAPVSYQFTPDAILYVKWNAGNKKVTLIGRAINGLISEYNFATISFSPPNSRDLRSNTRIISSEFINPVMAGLLADCEKHATTLDQAQQILNEIKNFSPVKENPKNTKYFYLTGFGNYNDLGFNFKRFAAIHEMNLRLQETRPNDKKYYSRITVTDNRLSKIEKIDDSNKDQEVLAYMKCSYDESDTLKFVKISSPKNQNLIYHINYDSNGVLSRIVEFNNFKLRNTSFIYSSSWYNDAITATYNHSMQKLTYLQHNLESDFLIYEYSNSSEEKDRFYTPTLLGGHQNPLISIKEACDKLGIQFYFKNFMKDEGYKPKKVYDAHFLKKHQDFIKSVTDITTERNISFGEKIEALMKAPQNPFYTMVFKSPVYLGSNDETLPFVINKIAKTAVQMKDTSGKLSTLFLNKVFLKRYQLVKILENGAELKDLGNNKTFTMQVNEPFTRKAARIFYKNLTHLVEEDELFFGYTLKYQEDTPALMKEDKKHLPLKGNIFNVSTSEEGDHKEENCFCQADYLSLDDFKVALTAPMDLSYKLKFCTFLLRLSTKHAKSNGKFRYTNKEIATWGIKSNNLVKLSSETFDSSDNMDFKLQLNRGKFYVKNKQFQLSSIEGFKTKKLALKIDRENYLILDFIPNNSCTLKRMIKNFSWNRHYFANNTKNVNFKLHPFNYDVRTNSNEIQIDDKTVQIKFKDGQIFLKEANMQHGKKLVIRNE
ncbi:MAG: hypothetical protein NE327_21800 [Lentisphaeraceae bacterium]|nr:hypothetical protein [Lentisphaeraceae bacterium]